MPSTWTTRWTSSQAGATGHILQYLSALRLNVRPPPGIDACDVDEKSQPMNALRPFAAESILRVAVAPQDMHCQRFEPAAVVNCLPFLGLESKVRTMGGSSMTIYDRSVRERACGLFDRGFGSESAAKRLGIPVKAVRKWQLTYRAAGRDGLPNMGKTHAKYDYETKVAAASAVVDGGTPKPGAMKRFGIASESPLKKWCQLYREGGAEALGPRPKGRPRGSGADPAPATREEELEREVGRLEAQVAYLRKSIALKAELGLLPGSGRRP